MFPFRPATALSYLTRAAYAPYRSLGLIWLSFIALGWLYQHGTPPFEGPDEPQHFAYVEWLATGRGLPPQGPAAWETPVRQEAGQGPLYYWLASWPARWAGVAEPGAWFRPNPYFPSNAPGHVPDNKNIAVHHPEALALTLTRGVTLLFGLALLGGVYGLAYTLQPDWAAGATWLVALTPQVLFLSRVVSNDIPAAAASALTLWALAHLAQAGPTWQRGALVGLGLGAAALCKSNTLILIAPVGLVWLALAFRQAGRAYRRSWLAAGAATAAVALLSAGWWYGRNWQLYGAPLGLEAHDYAPWAQPLAASALAQAREVFYSWWLALGWGNIKPPGWVYLPLAVAVALGVMGLARLVRPEGQPWARRVVVGALVALCLAAGLALGMWMQRVTAPHGRLLYPALGAAAVLLTAGWRALIPRLTPAILLYLGGLALAAPIFLLRPAYAPPAHQPDVVAALGVRWGEAAELLAVTPLQSDAAAGETLTVEVCWRVLAPTPQDYTLFVQLVGPGDGILAQRHTYPGLGSYPTSTWTAGRQFCDPVRLEIPSSVPETLLYRLEVGLFDAATGARLSAVGADGQQLEHHFVGAVRVATVPRPTAPLPDTTQPIFLHQAQFPPQGAAGATLPLTLTWQATIPLTTTYTTFVHLRDANGRNVAQADGPPRAGWYPTDVWPVGELVADARPLLLPADLPAGMYHLVVGWYDPALNQRLGQEWPVGQVELQPTNPRSHGSNLDGQDGEENHGKHRRAERSVGFQPAVASKLEEQR